MEVQRRRGKTVGRIKREALARRAWKRFVQQMKTGGKKAGGNRRKSGGNRRKSGGDPAAFDLAAATSQEVAEFKGALDALQNKVVREAEEARAAEEAIWMRLDALQNEVVREAEEARAAEEAIRMRLGNLEAGLQDAQARIDRL